MSTKGEFDFTDLKPIFIEGIKVPGSDGVVREYVLREASEDAAINYSNAKARGAKLVAGNQVVMEGTAEADAILLASCLFERYIHPNQGTKERPTTFLEVKSWLHRIVEPLVKKAKEISKLDLPRTTEQIDKQIKLLQTQREVVGAAEVKEEPDGTEADQHPKGSSPATGTPSS